MFRSVARTTVAIGLMLAVVACSKKVDSSSVESQVVSNVKSVFKDVKDVSADCPGDVKAEKGKKFSCKLTLDGQTTNVGIEITEVKDKRFTFDLKPTQAIIPVGTYERNLAQQSGAGAKVSCGKDRLLIKDPGDVITCRIKLGSQSQNVKLKVKDAQGNLEPVK